MTNPHPRAHMKLTGPYRIVIEGDTDALISAGGRNRDLIGYIMQRLLTGDEAAVEELDYWGISVRDENGEQADE